MVIGIVAIIILGVIAYFLCELSEVPEEEYKPRKKIEKIYIRGTVRESTLAYVFHRGRYGHALALIILEGSRLNTQKSSLLRENDLSG